MTGEKLEIEEELLRQIVQHTTLTDLMYVGNQILKLRLRRWHLLILEAWKKEWKQHFNNGEVDPAAHAFYHTVKRDLLREAQRIPLEPMHFNLEVEVEPDDDLIPGLGYLTLEREWSGTNGSHANRKVLAWRNRSSCH